MNEQIEQLLMAAFESKASDLHVTIGVPPVLRINGDLKHYGEEKLTPAAVTGMAQSIMSEKQWQTLQERGELDFSYGLQGVTRFRINAYFQRLSIGLAIRVIPSEIPKLEDLHLPEVLKKLATKPQGLILVTGPTGSGKSTTLAALIHHMNLTMRRHIITLEDPIEYLHQHHFSLINQREIGHDTNNFATGLRAALRQDPDVILVGEMRDLETIATAITAAETGHLVLGTLHTADAHSTIDRILDVFPPNQQAQIRIQLADVLVAILSQRLFPTLDRRGRIAATELMINNSATANLIRNEKTHQIVNTMQMSRGQGMHTLEMSMNELVQKKLVAKEVVEPYLREMST